MLDLALALFLIAAAGVCVTFIIFIIVEINDIRRG